MYLRHCIQQHSPQTVPVSLLAHSNFNFLFYLLHSFTDRYLHMMPCNEMLDSNNSSSSMAQLTSTVSASTSDSLELHRHESADPTPSCTKKC